MKYVVRTLWIIAMLFPISCSVSSPTANQVTIEVTDQCTSSTCPVSVSLDTNGAVSLGSTNAYTFPAVSAGSHVLKFTTGGSCPGGTGNCVYTNTGSSGTSYSVTFNTVSGNQYNAYVTQGTFCNALTEWGP
jgi:hypothetical protein